MLRTEEEFKRLETSSKNVFVLLVAGGGFSFFLGVTLVKAAFGDICSLLLFLKRTKFLKVVCRCFFEMKIAVRSLKEAGSKSTPWGIIRSAVVQ